MSEQGGQMRLKKKSTRECLMFADGPGFIFKEKQPSSLQQKHAPALPVGELLWEGGEPR